MLSGMVSLSISSGLWLTAMAANPLGADIAKRAGVPLKIAAKVDKVDEDYFEEVIRPLLDHPLIEFIGEIDEQQKGGFLGNALALLFPIDWPEPFGLVMIEAMSAGTPVIAWRHGSAPEVIDDQSPVLSLIRSMRRCQPCVWLRV